MASVSTRGMIERILYHPIERIRGSGAGVGNYPFIVHQTSPTEGGGECRNPLRVFSIL